MPLQVMMGLRLAPCGVLRWCRHINPMRYSNDLVTHLYLAGSEVYSCKTDGTSNFAKCNVRWVNGTMGDGEALFISQEEVGHAQHT